MSCRSAHPAMWTYLYQTTHQPCPTDRPPLLFRSLQFARGRLQPLCELRDDLLEFGRDGRFGLALPVLLLFRIDCFGDEGAMVEGLLVSSDGGEVELS